MARPPLLAIRADGGPGVGSGHLARCLALVEEWIRRQGEAVLISRDPPPFWRDHYAAQGCRIIDPDAVTALADWLVIDGYLLDGTERQRPHSRLLLIDDFDSSGTSGAGADLVLDQNLGAAPGRYERATEVLVGPSFALLRREVAGASPRPRVPATAPGPLQLLVTFGGSPDRWVQQLDQSVVSDPRLAGVEIVHLNGADAVDGAMTRADVALAAAGSVSWELCYFGVPSVLVPVAPNQERIAQALADIGAAVTARPEASEVMGVLTALIADSALQAQLSSTARRVVDGRGAQRVVDEMLSR